MDRMTPFSDSDLRQLADIGIPPSEVERQLSTLRNPPSPVRLLRPCVLGDGIHSLTDTDRDELCEDWRSLVRERSMAKFVPASGAATRMFKDLTVQAEGTEPAGVNSVQRLVESLPRLAFFDALQSAIAATGTTFESVQDSQDFEAIVSTLLEPAGLGYDSAPKALIPFHRYPEGPRSALEEQLREGLGYLAGEHGTARFHFTVSPDHEAAFRRHAVELSRTIAQQKGLEPAVSFSTQSPATDTAAVDAEHRLVRRPDGTILLRPAGHGALLGNLQRVDADVVFIKNIDNVGHERLQPVTVQWKRTLAGLFVRIQSEIFELCAALDQPTVDRETIDRGLEILGRYLAVQPPAAILDGNDEIRANYLRDRLDRPLRVCGVVRNEGEPGGGPFWMPDGEGGATGQIVESAQIDKNSPEQVEIAQAATHFNPVDLVCGLRDRWGRPYELDNYVDPSTSFVAKKSFVDQVIRVLERPGLWNGSMAGWNTAFVEVPLDTFTPVKTVFDLLRPEHQP